MPSDAAPVGAIPIFIAGTPVLFFRFNRTAVPDNAPRPHAHARHLRWAGLAGRWFETAGFGAGGEGVIRLVHRPRRPGTHRVMQRSGPVMDPAAHFKLTADPFSARGGLPPGNGPLAQAAEDLMTAIRRGERLINLVGGAGTERALLLGRAEAALTEAGVSVRRLAAADAGILMANRDADAVLVEDLYGDSSDVRAALQALATQIIKPAIVFAAEAPLFPGGEASLVRVPALTEDAARRYLAERLSAVGGDPSLFSGEAVEALVRAARGSLTRLRVLAGNALLDAALEDAHQVDAAHVGHAAAMLPAVHVADTAEAADREPAAAMAAEEGPEEPAPSIEPAPVSIDLTPAPRLMAEPAPVPAADRTAIDDGRDANVTSFLTNYTPDEPYHDEEAEHRSVLGLPGRKRWVFAGALAIAVLAAALLQWGGLTTKLFPRGDDTQAAATMTAEADAVRRPQLPLPIEEDAADADPVTLPETATGGAASPDGEDRTLPGESDADPLDAETAEVDLGSDVDTEEARPPLHVIVHYADGRTGARDRAESVAAYLRARGYDVASLRPAGFNIGRGSTRYFHSEDADRTEALNVQVTRVLTSLGADSSQVMDMTTATSAPAEGAVEVWVPSVPG